MTKTPALPVATPYTVRSRQGDLGLTNDGQLSLFFIGVGGAFSKRHYQNNLLVVKGDDHLLVDCGTRTPQAFYELGCPLARVRNFYVTHTHADHIGGLEEAMLVGRYGTAIKPRIWISEGFQSILWDNALRGGSGFNEEKDGAPLEFADFWEVHRPRARPEAPREALEFEVGGIRLRTFRTLHIPALAPRWQKAFWSTGLVIDERVVFTGDTRFDRGLFEEVASQPGIEAIFHDCQFLPPGGVHASLEELAQLPPEVREKTVLMHYGDDWEKHQARAEDLGFRLTQQWTYYDFPGPRTSGRA